MTGPEGAVFRFERAEAILEDLTALERTVAEACDAAGAPPAVRADLRLAVEETFTNILVHGYGSVPGRVRCEVVARAGDIHVRFDDDADWFAPEDVPVPPLTAPWSERKIGGLGWHLIRRLMDEVRHTRRTPRGNALTLVKRWEQ